MPNSPKLYALLAAVDAYRYPVRPLNGCVNDIMRFKQYLETAESRNFQLQIEVLTNEKATKGNIVKRFEDHLAKAGPEDIALFYYAGHGAQEKADPAIWRFEPDGKLEGLVCYDSIPSTGQNFNLLVDKELRFMIHRLAHGTPQKPRKDAPHVVMIFDCCHSGDNTRNVYIAKESRAVRERKFKPMPAQAGQPRMGAILPPRKWDQFLFAKDIKLADLKSKPLPEVMPEGRHVQLAACQSDESAYESGGSGVFSRN
ncbi:MAG: caspase family protein, partial [Haliscomenobacter sp.]|nr:caspase family protein [Haliscomenobacter sp.]